MSVKMQLTRESRQRATKMEENLNRLMEEAQAKQEETRPRNIEEQDVTCVSKRKLEERSRKKAEAGQVSSKGGTMEMR